MMPAYIKIFSRSVPARSLTVQFSIQHTYIYCMCLLYLHMELRKFESRNHHQTHIVSLLASLAWRVSQQKKPLFLRNAGWIREGVRWMVSNIQKHYTTTYRKQNRNEHERDREEKDQKSTEVEKKNFEFIVKLCGSFNQTARAQDAKCSHIHVPKERKFARNAIYLMLSKFKISVHIFVVAAANKRSEK